MCVWGVGVCLCARASVCGCARTCIMSHAFLMGSAKQQMTTTTNTSMRDTYNANIEKAEKEWQGRGQKDRDWILGCLESRAPLSPFISHAYLDMGVWVMAVCNCPLGCSSGPIKHPPPSFHNKNCIVIPSSWGSSPSTPPFSSIMYHIKLFCVSLVSGSSRVLRLVFAYA